MILLALLCGCSFIPGIFLFFFQISAPLLDEGQVRSIADEIKKVLTDSLNRKREQAERTKSEDFVAEESAEDFDAEESDLNYEEFELEEDIFHYVCISQD